MDRYRVAPARPVFLSSASGSGGHLRAGASRRRPIGGAEIGIFTAERYFSAADVVRRHDGVLRTVPPDDDRHHEPPPGPTRMSIAASDLASCQSGRTAASSEASWNSRSGLLLSAGGGGHHSAAVLRMKGSGGGGDRYGGGGKKKKKPGFGQRWTLFRRYCPCAGRKAVAVDAASSEPRSPAMDARYSAQSAVEECLESAIFKAKTTPSPPSRPPVSVSEEAAKVKVTVTPGSRAFPIVAANDVVLAVASTAALNRGAAAVPSEAFAAAISRRAGGFTTFPAARFTSSSVLVLDEPPRASLEVFRPIDEDSVMLADPPPPAGRDLVLRTRPAVVDEEAMSDASSDLFDLESFAASSSYPTTYHGRGSRRNSADDDLPPYAAALAEPALSECGMYAPSEASVVWSVATAEGGAFDAASTANFSSAASACCGLDEFRFAVPEESPAEFTAAMSRSAVAVRKKGGGGGGFLNSCRCEKAVSVGPTPVRMVKPPAYPAAKKKGGGSAARCHPAAGHVDVPVRT